MRSILSRLPHSQVALTTGLLAFMLVASYSGSASANPEHDLAPAGPCATAREAISGSSQAGASSSFSIVGPLGAFFSPADVAAAPVTPARPAPTAAALTRPGPCDNPGAGCGLFPQQNTPPIVGGTRP